ESGALITFDSMLQQTRRVPLMETANSLAVDAAGFATVIGESGTAYVYSPGGILQRSFALPGVFVPAREVSIDVSPEGCTLVYLGAGGKVNRFDSCSQMALAAPDERFTTVRALNDGGFAGVDGDRIEFFD